MKTFRSAFLMVLILIGCSYDDTNIMASQEETNTKLDSLMVIVREPVPLTRIEMIKARFHSLLAFVYKSANVDTGREDEEHEHIQIRYAEYYTFTVEPSDLYDGWYTFNRYLLADSYQELQQAKMKNFANPAVFGSQGRWRILSEKDIEFARTYGIFYDFQEQEWDTADAGIVGIDRYSYHGDRIMIGSARGGDTFRTTTMKDIVSVKKGDFDK